MVRIEQLTVIKGNYHEGNNGSEECKSDDTTDNLDTNGPEQHGHPARRKVSDTSIATDDSEGGQGWGLRVTLKVTVRVRVGVRKGVKSGSR